MWPQFPFPLCDQFREDFKVIYFGVLTADRVRPTKKKLFDNIFVAPN